MRYAGIIPNDTSNAGTGVCLSFYTQGCPHKCEGCHSQYLWEYKGRYIADDLIGLIEKYSTLITCICFMGGDQNIPELLQLAFIVKQYNLKVALYSGLDDDLSLLPLYETFDYIKVGHYDQNLGGLDKKTTNQKMYQRINNTWENITYKFWKED